MYRRKDSRDPYEISISISLDLISCVICCSSVIIFIFPSKRECVPLSCLCLFISVRTSVELTCLHFLVIRWHIQKSVWLIMSEYLLFVGKSRRSHLKASFLSDVLVCSELVIIQVLRPSPHQWFSNLFLEAEKTTHPTLKYHNSKWSKVL